MRNAHFCLDGEYATGGVRQSEQRAALAARHQLHFRRHRATAPLGLQSLLEGRPAEEGLRESAVCPCADLSAIVGHTDVPCLGILDSRGHADHVLVQSEGVLDGEEQVCLEAGPPSLGLLGLMRGQLLLIAAVVLRTG